MFWLIRCQNWEDIGVSILGIRYDIGVGEFWLGTAILNRQVVTMYKLLHFRLKCAPNRIQLTRTPSIGYKYVKSWIQVVKFSQFLEENFKCFEILEFQISVTFISHAHPSMSRSTCNGMFCQNHVTKYSFMDIHQKFSKPFQDYTSLEQKLLLHVIDSCKELFVMNRIFLE